MNWWTWFTGLFGSKPKPVPPKPPVAPLPINLDVIRARVVALHNQYRTAHGLSPLTVSSNLNNAAQAHADDMAIHRKLDHTGSDGSESGDRITRAGYAWSLEGENIEWGSTTADAVMAVWLNSPGHLANIRRQFRNIGVGRSGVYWTVNFASPR